VQYGTQHVDHGRRVSARELAAGVATLAMLQEVERRVLPAAASSPRCALLFSSLLCYALKPPPPPTPQPASSHAVQLGLRLRGAAYNAPMPQAVRVDRHVERSGSLPTLAGCCVSST
jgi:hypothetical protein